MMERGDMNSGLTDINGNQIHMASTEIGNLSVTVLEAADLQVPDALGTGEGGEVNYERLGEDSYAGQMRMDPRVVLMYDRMSQCTSSIEGQRAPQWGMDGTGENFLFSVTDKTFQTMLIAKVYSGAIEIGGCVVSIQDCSGDKGRTVDNFFDLESESGEYRGKLRLCLEYTKQTARRNELTQMVNRIDIGNLQQTVTRTHVDYKDLLSEHTDFKDPNQQAVFDQRNLRTKLFDKLKTAFFDDLRMLKKRELQMGGKGGEGMGTYIPVGCSQLRIGILGGRELIPTNQKSILHKMGFGVESSDVFVKCLFRPDTDMSHPDVVVGTTNTEYACGGSGRTVDPVFGSNERPGTVSDATVVFQAGTDENAFVSQWESVKFYRFVGVTYEGESWRARYQGKDLGQFETEEKAAFAYDAYVRAQARKGLFGNTPVQCNFPKQGEQPLQRRLDDDNSGYFQRMYKHAFAIGAGREGMSPQNVMNYFCQPSEDNFDDTKANNKSMTQSGWANDFADVIFEVYDEEKDDQFEGGRTHPQAMGECGIPMDILNDQSFKSFDGFQDGSNSRRLAWTPMPFAECGGKAVHPSQGQMIQDRQSKNHGKVRVKCYNEETEYTYIGCWTRAGNVWQMDDAEDGILMYGDEIIYRGQWQQGQLKMPLVLPVKASVGDEWPDRARPGWMGQLYVYIELIEQTPVSRAEIEQMELRHNQKLDGAIRKEMELFKPLEQQDPEFRDRLQKRWKQKCMGLIPGMPNSIPYRRSMTEFDDGLYPWFYECDHVLYQIAAVKQMQQNDIACYTRALAREIEQSKECMREVDQSFHDDYLNYCRSRHIANLDITIIEALDLELPEAKDPSSKRRFNFADSVKSEPYVKIFDEFGAELWRSKHRKSERNPKWNETFTLQVRTDGSRLIPERIRLQAFDHDGMFGDDSFLGEVWLEIAHIRAGVWLPSTEELPERYGLPGLMGNAEPPKCVKNGRIPGHPHYNEIAVAKYGKGQLAKQHFANEKEKANAAEISRLRREALKSQQQDDPMAAQAEVGMLGQRGIDVEGMNSGMGGSRMTRGLANMAMQGSTIYAIDPYDTKEVLNYNPADAVKVSRKGDGHVCPYKEMDNDGLWLLNPMQSDKILAVGTTMDIVVNNVDPGKWERSMGKDATSAGMQSSTPSFDLWKQGGKQIPQAVMHIFGGSDPWHDSVNDVRRDDREVYAMMASLMSPTQNAESANPHQERYEMRVGQTEHLFQIMIDNPEKPIMEIHRVIIKKYESGREEVILQMSPGKKWHWENSWKDRSYWIMQVLPKNPYHIYDKLPTGRHQELEIIKCLREPEVVFSEEQDMELEGMFLYGLGQSGGFDAVTELTHTEQEAHIDGWYNVKPIMPAPGQIFHTDDEDHNDLDHAEESVPPMMRGFLRLKTSYTPVEVTQDDREDFDRIRNEKSLAEVTQGGQDEYLQEEIRQLMYNEELREQLRQQVPSDLTRQGFWMLHRTKEVRNFMLANLLQALMTKKCVKDDRHDLIERVKKLFVDDHTVLERFPAAVFNPAESPHTHLEIERWKGFLTGAASKTIGSFTMQIKRGKGLLPETGDQIQRVFVSRYARARVIGGCPWEGENKVRQFMAENKCSFQEYQHMTQDIGRPQKVSRAALGSNPMGFNQSSFNKFDQSVVGQGEAEENELTRQNPSSPNTFGDNGSVPFYVFDESNLIRIEVIDRTKKLERVTLDEKKTFIMPDTQHGKVAHEVKGVSTRQEDRYLEEEVCVGVITVSYKELLKIFEDTDGEAFEQWFNVGPDTTFELMSTMQMRQRYLKQKPRGRVCVEFDLHDKSLRQIKLELEHRKASARQVRCQIESRTLLDEMKISMFEDGLSVSNFYTEFTDKISGVITKETLTRGLSSRYQDRLFSSEAVEGVWNELDGSGQRENKLIVTLIAAKHTTTDCRNAAGRYTEVQNVHVFGSQSVTINHKPVYRHQDGRYAIAFNGEHWVIMQNSVMDGLLKNPKVGFASPLDHNQEDEKVRFCSNGTVEDEKTLITSAWSEFRIFRGHEIQDGVVTFVEFCTALGFDPGEDPEVRDMKMPVNFLNTKKLEKWISTLSNRKIGMLLDQLNAEGKDDITARLQTARLAKERGIRERAVLTRDSLIDMMKYHASFAKKIKNIFHHDYIHLLEVGGTYDIGGLREFKLFTAKPATLLIQIETAEQFRLPMVDDIHSDFLYPSDLQLELIHERQAALDQYLILAAELANLQQGTANNQLSKAELAAKGVVEAPGKQVNFNQRVKRVNRRMAVLKATIEKLNSNSQFRTGALSRGWGEASPFALLYPYVRLNALAGAKNISVAKIRAGKDDDALLMAQNVKVVTDKGPMARRMEDPLTQIPSTNPQPLYGGDSVNELDKTQAQTLFKVDWPKEVFKFDVNDVHMGAVDMNLMSDVPDGHGRNSSPDDIDYFGGDATLDDGSDRRTRKHQFGNSATDERTRDTFLGSVRINTEDMWHTLKDDIEKEKVARRHRGDQMYNREHRARHEFNHLMRRCENMSGCEEEMVAFSKTRDNRGRPRKPELKFEIVVKSNGYRSVRELQGGTGQWRDITDKKESAYSSVLAEYMQKEFKDVMNHPTKGRFSSMESHFDSSTYTISADYLCGSLRRDDRVHVIDGDAAFSTQHHKEGIVKGLDKNFQKNRLVKVEFGDGVLQTIHEMNLKNVREDMGVFQLGGQVEYHAKDDLIERGKLFDNYQVRLRKKNPAKITVDKIEVGPQGIRLTCSGPAAPVYSPDFGMMDYIDGLAKGKTRSGSHAPVGGKDLNHLKINSATLAVVADKVWMKICNARKILRENKSLKSASALTQRSDLQETMKAIRICDALYEALDPENKTVHDLHCYVADKWFFPLVRSEMDVLSNQLTVLERFDTRDTDAHMQYEAHEGGNSLTTCQWISFEPSKAQQNAGMTAGRLKVKMKLQMRENVEPYDTAEFVPHDDLVKILHKINAAFGSTEKWLMATSRNRDYEVQKVLKLQRDLGVRIRNEARIIVLERKINFMALKDVVDAPREIRLYKDPAERRKVKSEWLPDARTGQMEPILDLIKEVNNLCDKPEYKHLIADNVKIPMPMYHKVHNQNTLRRGCKMPKHATLVLEQEQLLPAELGQEDRPKKLQQELHLVRQKIRMALQEGEEIRATMNQEVILVPRVTATWNTKFKGVATKQQLYSMQKQLTANDLPGLQDDELDTATKDREMTILRQEAMQKEDFEFDNWKEATVGRTNSLSRTLTSLGSQLSRRASHMREGFSTVRSTPAPMHHHT